ncbi:MAG: stage V sporulation protein SpoVM [Ruminococcus sp.]|nr:stage V sporulation protein SpoVM [Ruminococcus sp.]
MKIVVVKSPKLLSGIFRIIFKIKREQPEEL